MSNLFIGITTWNSALFLRACLHSIRTTVPDANVAIVDNMSTDETCDIGFEFRARVERRRCSQPEALDRLCRLSGAKHTLLIHADVVFVAQDWYSNVVEAMERGAHVLVSPEDVGCGPYTRPWGRGMPESSFLFFLTDALPALRTLLWRRRFGVRWPVSRHDFLGDHVTYNIPMRLASRGLTWCPMSVHTSTSRDEPYYATDRPLRNWRPSFGHFRYGLGNFYSLLGRLTHYHNWYDRKASLSREDERQDGTLEADEGGVPVRYFVESTSRFLTDYWAGLAPGHADLTSCPPWKGED